MNMKLPQPPLAKVGVVGLVPDQWDLHWQVRHHVLGRLAKYFSIVWMNYPPGWRHSLSALQQRRTKLRDMPARPEGLQVYEPGFLLPNVGRPAWVGNLTSQQRLRRACNLLRARGCTSLVLYLWRPEFAGALEQVTHDLSIYHIDDEYSFSPTEIEVPLAERQLLESADQVFIHSPQLMKRKGGFNPNTELIPNGVDYRMYATAAPEPEDLRNIPHPRIGYVGYLKRMLDFSLLLELSRRHPHWSFVFVGPKRPHPDIDEALEQLARLPNVYFLGGKPSAELGAYPQHLDACIMPYRIDDYTNCIYPLKLHEYLASGTPVVSAPIRSVLEFGNVVTLASTGEEWSTGIEQALASKEGNPVGRRAERQRVACEHDWEKLVDKVAKTIARRLNLTLPDDSRSLDSELQSAAHL
jgi:glycosyltransferase involved in cell wall biosynthesis